MLISPVTWQNKQTAPLLMVVILVAHIHDLKNCQKLSASVDAFAENVSVTTSFPGFSRRDAWVNTQLRNPSATTNYVVLISGREFGSRRANLCQRKVSKWHIWILKPITKPFGYPQVKKWKRKKNDTKRRKKENLNLLCVPVLVPGWFDNKQTF